MAKMTRLTDAIFDVGGVLYTLNYDLMWQNFSRVSGIPIDKLKDILYEEETFINFEKGKISAIDYYKTVINGLGCLLSFDEFKRLFNSFLIKRNQMFDLLSSLEKHIKIHFLSNTNEINAEVLKDDLASITSSIIYSFQTGYRKPEHEIFRIALNKIGSYPKETIFIDDFKENVDAAREFGLSSCLFRSKKSLIKTFKQLGIPLQ